MMSETHLCCSVEGVQDERNVFDDVQVEAFEGDVEMNYQDGTDERWQEDRQAGCATKDEAAGGIGTWPVGQVEDGWIEHVEPDGFVDCGLLEATPQSGALCGPWDPPAAPIQDIRSHTDPLQVGAGSKANRCRKKLAFCLVCRAFLSLTVFCAIVGVGVVLRPPELVTDFDVFMEADIAASVMLNGFGIARSERESNSDASRRLRSAELGATFEISLMYDIVENGLSSILQKDVMVEIKQFEEGLRALDGWRRLCANTHPPDSGHYKCDPGYTLVHYVSPTLKASDLEQDIVPEQLQFTGSGTWLPPETAVKLVEREGFSEKLFPKDFDMSHPGGRLTKLRTIYSFSLFCCSIDAPRSFQMSWLEDRRKEWNDVVVDEVLPYLDDAVELLPPGLRLTWDGTGFYDMQVIKLIKSDLLLAAISMTFVLVYLTIHTQSILLSIVGVISVSMSVPLAYVCFTFVTGITKLNVASSLAVFLTLGLGADVVFVYTDFWRESELCCKTDSDRLSWTYKHAVKATMATTSATALSFLANVASVLKELRTFGLFMGLCVTFVWVVVPFVYMPLCAVHYWYVPTMECSHRRQMDNTSSSTSEKFARNLHRWRCCYVSCPLALMLTMFIVSLLSVSTSTETPVLLPDSHVLSRKDMVASNFYDYKEELSRKAPSTSMPICRAENQFTTSPPCVYDWCEATDLPLWQSGNESDCMCYRKTLTERWWCVGNKITVLQRLIGSGIDVSAAALPALRERLATHLVPMKDVWHLAPEGDVVCDYGVVANFSECGAAVQELGRQARKSPPPGVRVGRNGAGGVCGDSGWGGVPLGCSAHTTGNWKAYYKSSGPNCSRGDHRLVCRSTLNFDNGFANGVAFEGGAQDVVLQDWLQGLYVIDESLLFRALIAREPSEEKDKTVLGCGWEELCFCGDKQCNLDGDWKAVAPALDLQASPRRLAYPQWRVPRERRTHVDIAVGLQLSMDRPIFGEPADTSTVWSLSSDFQARTPWAQRQVYSLCMDVPESLRVVSKECWIKSFHAICVARGRFPVRPEIFDDYMSAAMSLQIERSAVKGSYRAVEDYLWLRDAEVKAFYMSFWVDFDKNSATDVASEYRKQWDAYINKYIAKGIIGPQDLFHISDLWVRADLQNELASSVVLTILVVITCAFFAVILFTQSVLLSAYVVFATMLIMSGLMFLIIVVLSSPLGPIEIIALIVFIGYSVTFSLHIAHLYGEKTFAQNIHDDADHETGSGHVSTAAVRMARVVFAFRSIGGATLGSGLTTVGCSLPLLFCKIAIFWKLGIVAIAVTLLSLLVSLVFLPAAFLVFGPTHPGCPRRIREIGQKLPWFSKLFKENDDGAEHASDRRFELPPECELQDDLPAQLRDSTETYPSMVAADVGVTNGGVTTEIFTL